MNVLNLFKYYAPKYNDKDNLSFHTEESIYFQKPTEFNDPWDCKAPPITCSRQLGTLKDIWFNLPRNKIDPTLVRAKWQKLRRESTRNEIAELLVFSFKNGFEGLRSKIGVFSLSFIPDCELMWSHYAISHSGYMLHFQIDIAQYCANSSLNNVVTLHPVKYMDKRDAWDLANYFTDRERHIIKLIRFKSKAWSYECELSLLNIDKWGFIKTPSNWLKSIIIGIKTEGGLQGKLEDIGKSLNVPVLRCKMNEKEYKIDIPGLGINGKDGETCYEEARDSEMFKF